MRALKMLPVPGLRGRASIVGVRPFVSIASRLKTAANIRTVFIDYRQIIKIKWLSQIQADFIAKSDRLNNYAYQVLFYHKRLSLTITELQLYYISAANRN